MDAGDWIAIAAAVVAAGALFYAGRSANAAREQTKIQRQIREDAAQPYVWVDIRPHDEHGQLLVLVIGNSGPTVATDVRVTFDPDLDMPGSDQGLRGPDARDALRRGISSLPPGRQLAWILGVPSQLINDGYARPYAATVLANGPFGAIPPLTYTLDVGDIRATHVIPPGTLRGVALALGSLDKSVSDVASKVAGLGRTTQHPDR